MRGTRFRNVATSRSTPTARSVVLGLGFGLAIAFGPSPSAGQQANASEPDPSDPTAAATNIQLIPEYNRADDFEAWIFRVNYDYDWAEGVYSINIEAPYGTVDFADGESETGFGDVRARFFWKFLDQPGERLSNAVFNLDVFVPTGNDGKGLGLGTLLVAPSLIFAYPTSDTFTIFPSPKVQFSTSRTNGRASAFPPGKNPVPGRESEEYIFALELETYFVKQLPTIASWAFLAPVINWDLLPEPGEDNYEITLKGQFGKIFGRTAAAIEATGFLTGEKSQDIQVKAIFFYYF